MPDAPTERRERRARALLALGASAGLALAAAHLLAAPQSDSELPAGVVARVEGVPIRSESYARLVGALAADRRTPLSDADRWHVLDRLIEEELLVQHAVALGLVESDRRVRGDLVSAVLASITAAAEGYEPDDAALEKFYADNRDYFAQPARLRVQRVFVARGDDLEAARERARRVTERLRAGEPLERVREALGDAVLAPVPDVPLPPAKLREYLGPSALEAALALPEAGVSDPVETPQGFHVLVLVARTDAASSPLAAVRAQVVAEMKRREGDRRLRERLDELRAEAHVAVVAELPELP